MRAVKAQAAAGIEARAGAGVDRALALCRRGRYRAAQSAVLRAIADYRRLGLPEGCDRARRVLAMLRGLLGDRRGARRLFLEVLESRERAQDRAETVRCLRALAVLDSFDGATRSGWRYAARAYRLAREAGDERRAADIRRVLSTLVTAAGHLHWAERLALQALERFRLLGAEAAHAERDLGWVLALRGRCAEARRRIAKAAELYRRCAERDQAANCEVALATLDWQEGKLEEARRRAEKQRTSLLASGGYAALTGASLLLGDLYASVGAFGLARERLLALRRILAGRGMARYEALTDLVHARLCRLRGHRLRAAALLSQAHAALERSGPIVDRIELGLERAAAASSQAVFGCPDAVHIAHGATGLIARTLTSPTGKPGSLFGYKIATSGRIIAAGAPHDSTKAERAGAVHLFDWETGEHLRTIFSPASQEYDGFGWTLALDGDNLVVGSWYGQEVYLFDTSGRHQQTFEYPGTVHDLAIEGDRVLVGGSWTSDPQRDTAVLFDATTGEAVHVFEEPAPDEWTSFGRAVALRDGRAIIGSWTESVGGLLGAGAVYVYATETGVLLAKLVDPSPREAAAFGISIAARGGLLLVGAYGRHPGPYPAPDLLVPGEAHLFDLNTYQCIASFEAPTLTGDGMFGQQVGIGEGRVFVGAPSDHTGGLESGAVYVFEELP